MRVLYVCADPGIPVPGTKGASIHVAEMTDALRALGHSVEVVAGGNSAADPDSSARGDVRHLLLHQALARQVDEIVGSSRPDVIYERHSLFSTVGVDVARRYGIPHLLEVNAPVAHEQARYRGLTLETLAHRLEEAALRETNAVVAVSRGLAAWASRIRAGGAGATPSRAPSVFVLANGVDAERFRPDADARRARRAQLGLQDRTVVGYVGSLKPWHATGDLMDALARLAPSMPRLAGLVVGHGPDRDRLEQRAKDLGLADRIHFTGPIPNHEVPEHIAAMDVAVAPYGAESPGPAGFYFSPLKIFEYMAAARPVVASRIGDIPEYIEHARTGYLADPGSRDSLATALRDALCDPAASAVGARARRRVLKRHTWSDNARAVVAMATQLLEAPGEHRVGHVHLSGVPAFSAGRLLGSDA